MKPHTVTLQEFQDWISKEEVTFASSSKERKRLVCALNGHIKVMVAGEVVWEGIQYYPAVEAYNGITEEYIDPLKDFKL